MSTGEHRLACAVQHSYHLDLPLLLCVLCLHAMALSAMLLPLLHSNSGEALEQVDRLLSTAQQLLFGLGCCVSHCREETEECCDRRQSSQLA